MPTREPLFQLKPIARSAIGRALEKVERYRLLNESWEAESICRDILAIDPENQEALIALLLSLADQFGTSEGRRFREAQGLLPRLQGEYDRAYYAGVLCERKGTSTLRKGTLGTGPIVYRWLAEAMEHYERAEALRPPDNDDAILRWNTCARLITSNEQVRPAPEIRQESLQD